MTLLLVIEDNQGFAAGLRSNLEVEGFEVELAHDAATGLDKVRRLEPALVILDLVLPDGDGYQVLESIRTEHRAMPVMVLSARHDERDKLRGYEMGADEFVPKPVSVLELVARVRAVLRRLRAGSAEAAAWIHIGDISVHPATRSVRRGAADVALSPKEYDLLLMLLRHRGRVVSRDELLHDVWHAAAGGQSRTVDTHILALRQKLEPDPRSPVHIVTVHSAGYMLRR